MKIIFTFLLFVSFTVFSQTRKDTTVKVDLNFDRTEETVNCVFDEAALSFRLTVNKAEITGQFVDAYSMEIEIIDINRNDNLREILVKGYGNSDQIDMYFFEYIDGKIVDVGHLPSNFGVSVTGNSELTEHVWMGFWEMKFRHDFNPKTKKITAIEDEFYEVNKECEARNPFKLLTKNVDGSPVAVEIKPKSKLTIVKADITPRCKSADGYDDDFFCDWYYFRTSDGQEGWCRLWDFYENVDGLVWAG